MGITRAQQAKQLLNKRIPFYAGGYSDSRDDPGGAHQQSMSSNDNDGGGGIGSDRAAAARAAAARASAARAKEDRDRQEHEQEKIKEAVKQAEENPFGKTFVDRGYVPPSTFDVRAAANRPPPVDEEETLLDKSIGYGKDLAKTYAKNTLLTSLGISNPFGLTALAISKMFGAAKANKARKDAIQQNFNKAQFSNSFYAGATPPSLSPTRGPIDTPDGGNEFPLIQAPFMIQPSIQPEVIEEEPTPDDFDLYAARDNRVGRRFAQGGRTGFNMGGMEEENLQAGAPDLRLEGNQVPQQEEMASMPEIDAELYQLFMDALRKGEIPQGTTFDAYKQLMMQMMSQQQGGQMQEEMMQPEMQEGIMQAQMMEPEREMAAFGGIMGSDGRRAYGLGSIFKKAKRAVKKIFKSDIGKAALIAAGGYYAGGGDLFGMQRAAGAARAAKGKQAFNFRDLNPFRKPLPISSKDSTTNMITKLENVGYTTEEATDLVKKQMGENILNPPIAINKNTGMSQSMNLAATLGIPALMGLVYKQGKADEKPMDQNTLARIEGYNNPLFEDGIAGARARILAGDNTGFNFRGPANIYAAEGGRIGANEGGLMNLGGNEMDLRGGGFVPLGAKEKADDVPARLSKNEFVFTADAVRAAGGGSVDKGAEKMYNTMKRLEGVMA